MAAFPGVTLTARELGSETPPRPTVTSTPCPVCAAAIRSDDFDVIRCTRCRAEYHGPCFWRVLPIGEWVAYLTWVYASPLEDLDRREYRCAACRPAGDA
jgi:hypothetical protein